MANDITINEIVANMALAEFQNNNSFVMTAFRGYESDFPMSGYKQGDTINIRKQNFANVVDGRITTIDDIDEETESLVVSHQYNSSIEVNSKELTLDLDTNGDRFNERYIRPRIKRIVKQMNAQIAQDAISQLHFAIGTAGTPLNSFGAIDEANVKLLEQAVDLDEAYFALSLRDGSALKNSLVNFFNDTLNDDIAFRSQLGRLADFDLFADQSIKRHTTGTLAGSPVVNGQVNSGNTIVMDGATASQTGVFRVGDSVSFVGVNSVNPVDKSDTGQLMQFVVLDVGADADGNIDSDAGGNVTITVDPAIVSDLAATRRNVSGPILDGVAASIYGVTAPGTAVTYNTNVAYANRGLSLVVPPMDVIDLNRQYTATDKKTNISVRVGFQGDIINDVNVMRVDVLCGWKWHGDYATKVIS